MRIVWWNTGLSPTRARSKLRTQHVAATADVLIHLIDVAQADVIVLGEMSEASAWSLREACTRARLEYNWLSAFHRAGRSRFSVCILSRKDRVRVEADEPILFRDGKSVIKAGLYFAVRLLEAGEWCDLIVSHWPSRLHMDRHDSGRTHIAAFLRRWIEDNLPGLDDDANVVLIGDFNDEPFDEGLERYLHASRDRDKVKRNAALLYNPFWRHLSSFVPGDAAQCLSDPGTYFHRGGRDSWWRTFDQMIVSSAVLFGRAGWRLNEADTRVVPQPPSGLDVRSRHRFFDHLPIIGHLERLPT